MRMNFVRSALLASAFLLAGGAAQAEKLVVGATQVPHAEILEVVKPALAKEGVELDIKVFTDYVQPNLQLADKQLDANFFQPQPYLDTFNKDRKTNLVSVGLVHVEPFGGYSKKIKSLAELKDGATIAIPNDPSNSGRALLLLQKQGLLKLKDPSNIVATPIDIAENPKKLKFRELEAAMLPRSFDDLDLALINTNYALEAGLVPTRDALFIEGADSPYANLVAARPDNKDAPAVKKLVNALHSEAVRKFIIEKYKGAVVPAF
ncbi:D-methionine ABC transporter substrate-binding protein [Bordetella pertussis]|uniref:MetQ/NlpA family ABC transporter substrate-binding protein n=1 Tax=Bordetella pertussis TaxID=520 RepID=UPI0005E4CBB7|nr:MetQ/NlpA family ABC transporter substrate-binding protein [Bordetella pertussis]CFE01423.1 D-methionine ABC transporter substrate-binding protein [Bordetella pertussis]CFL90779.1 D-methionine ABC transporter substrate-binding protein [Bordetella pertussis]CFM89617.1 D-methionine ABC transporter substrate-binding protein [Bordetella pertussis]CFN03605.1 D-methionine ABC transporter substrate-binding protein [Bordetella pertussis]CFN50253.1 D-methionine ABC transporter substrate-binding prot